MEEAKQTATAPSALDEAVAEVHAQTDEQTVMSTYKDILYKTTNGKIGESSHML